MTINELMQEGLVRYAAGNVSGAVECWEAILREDEAHVQSRRYLENVRRMRAATQKTPSVIPAVSTPPADPWGASADGVRQSVITAQPPADALAAVQRSAAETRLPVPELSPADDEVGLLMKGARDVYALHDFSGALELLGKVLARAPRHVDALALHNECLDQLQKMLLSKLGGPDGIVKVLLPPEDIIWLNIDHRAGFVLSHIDGHSSIDEIVELSGMERLVTLRLLVELLEARAIGV